MTDLPTNNPSQYQVDSGEGCHQPAVAINDNFYNYKFNTFYEHNFIKYSQACTLNSFKSFVDTRDYVLSRLSSWNGEFYLDNWQAPKVYYITHIYFIRLILLLYCSCGFILIINVSLKYSHLGLAETLLCLNS